MGEQTGNNPPSRREILSLLDKQVKDTEGMDLSLEEKAAQTRQDGDKGTPQTPETPETKPDVPEKFLTKDGKIDEQKLERSTQQLDHDVMKKLERYAELEKKNTQLGQKLAESKKQEPTQQPPFSPPPEPTLSDRFGEAWRKEINKKFATTDDPASLVIDIANQVSDAKVLSIRQDMEMRAQEQKSRERQDKLAILAQKDPWVVSEEGYQAISDVMERKPWLWQSDDPYGDAFALLGRTSGPISEGDASQKRAGAPVIKSGTTPPIPSTKPSLSVTEELSDMRKGLPFALRNKKAGEKYLAELENRELQLHDEILKEL